jgi:Fur family zinc uptake transcriptional regulator
VVDHKIEQMLNTMAGKGLRITEQRKTMARLFAEAPGYLTAKEVYEGLEAKHSGLSFDTVYRNLRVLEDLGVVEQFHFEDGIKFRIGCFSNNHNHHHHHLICISCDHIYPLDFCPMPYVKELPNHFVVLKHKFEIFGNCNQCAT